MSKTFNVGDHVRWNSEAGEVSGVIKKKHTQDTEYKRHMRRCSPEEPQYEIKSDKRLYYKGCLDCSYKACAIVPKGSYAEEYCRDNRIAFTYKE